MSAPNNPFPALSRAVDPAIVRNIRQASLTSSADFGLLMAQAQQESGFDPSAKAASGSAAGLFQFVDSTWLDMVHRFGAKYGVGALAQQIGTDASGKPTVSDPAVRQRILALRNDAGLAASLAGEYANLNKSELEQALGRPASRADLYMAHFLGAAGATSFLKALATKGGTSAADLLPDAAQSNPSIFYDSDGRARSVGAIYRMLGSRIEQAADGFGGAAGTSDMSSSDVVAAMMQGSGSSLSPRLDFDGLNLTPPVASMLDALTLAALKLIGNNDPAARSGTTGS
jgi:Transglycosylase SLT domain